MANSQLINLVLAANTFLIAIIWTILKFTNKSLSLYIPVYFMIVHVVDINLMYADKLYPSSLVIDDKSQYRDQLLIYFLLANLVNFMDLKLTVFLLLPIYLCG